MSTKELILSSSGLKNLVSGVENDEEFEFIFGQHKISMNNVFAEFISPIVSKLHQTDPTANFINFEKELKDVTLSENSISKFNLLSNGETVTISEEESFEMKIISIIINNEELFHKLNELFSSEINETNIDLYLSNLTFFSQFSTLFDYFNYNYIIDTISSHFYSIDKKKLKQIPKPIIYSIICNSKLQLESEDSLFDFLNDYLNEEDKSEIIYFYEEVEYSMLSDTKFDEFIDSFDSSKMTQNLWTKLRQCFYTNKSYRTDEVNVNRYLKKITEEESDSYEIIDYLTKQVGGNVHEKGVVNVTASSTYFSQVRNAVDIHNNSSFFCSQKSPNSWLKYDFNELKVHPTGYLITTRPKYDNHHPRNWVIEGSNIDKDNDWVILDSRQDEKSLAGLNVTRKFDIKSHGKSYRYLRIRQTGKNSGNDDYLIFSSLEFIGTLSDYKQ